MTRTTKTFATTNIVITMAGSVFAEDFEHEQVGGVPDRVGGFIDSRHARIFPNMKLFTEWLHERQAIVETCVVLPPELLDAERQP